jgi:hypothetical protein
MIKIYEPDGLGGYIWRCDKCNVTIDAPIRHEPPPPPPPKKNKKCSLT